VLVQRVKAEARTAGGIFLPESSVKELNEANVLAVGPGGFDKDGKRISMSVQAGDKVLIPQVCDHERPLQKENRRERKLLDNFG
jgi:chaperonin GroES